jgi:hypothetical protein
MPLNQRVTAEFSTCAPSAPPTADSSIQIVDISGGRSACSGFDNHPQSLPRR